MSRLEGLAQPGREVLHFAVGSDAESAWVHTVRAVFDDSATADDAVADLLRHAVAPSSVSIAPADDLHGACCDPRAGSAVRAVVRGAGLGGLAGAVVGVLSALTVVSSPGLDATLPLLALAVGGFGAVSGALISLAVGVPLDDDPLEEVVGGPGSVVVTARSLRADRIRERLVRRGGRPLDTHPPVHTDVPGPPARTRLRDPARASTHPATPRA